MDVAFLNPQDCLTNPLSKRHFVSPHMKKHRPKNSTPNRSNRSPNQLNRRNSDSKRNSPPPSRAAVVNKVPVKSPVMGQVKILKRGEEIDSKMTPLKVVEANIQQVERDLGSTKLLGPDPKSVPTQIRLGSESMKTISNVAASFYAGSAFNVISPPPSSLPLPAFFTKKLVGDENDVASSILKQVLRLDLK